MINAILFLAFSIAYWYAFAWIGGSLPDGDPARRPIVFLFIAVYGLVVAGIAIYRMRDEPF